MPVLCHLSHVYPDGASLYFTFFFRRVADPEAAIARWAALKRAATEALTAAGGTFQPSPRRGLLARPLVPREAGEAGVRLMAAAARGSWTRAGILNPHVLLDPADRLEIYDVPPGLAAAGPGRALGETFDLVVVGGGITGCGMLLDAAQRGLRVLLVEKATTWLRGLPRARRS